MTTSGNAARVIFLNRYFHPDHSATSQMLSDLAFALAERGYRVVVITSRLRYDAPGASLPPAETIRGVDVVRVWTSKFGRHNLVGRAVDYVTFYLAAAWALWRLARRDDVVVAKTDPPMISVVAAPIAAWRGARLVNWLQDIFPEVAQALGVGRGATGRVLHHALRWVRDLSLRHAAVNVVLGQRMAQTLQSRGIPDHTVRIIPNWTDVAVIVPHDRETNPLRLEWGLEHKFVVGYSGNLGRAHESETLLAAAALIEATGRANGSSAVPPPIVWLMIGGGAEFERLKGEAAWHGLNCFVFKDYQPREQLALSLSAADVHLVSLRPELEGLIVPSKFYGIAAAGRPTVFIGADQGEIAQLLAKHGCGLTTPQGDAKRLAEVLTGLAGDPARCRAMGDRARRACETSFDRQVAFAAWVALLTALGVQPTAGPDS